MYGRARSDGAVKAIGNVFENVTQVRAAQGFVDSW